MLTDILLDNSQEFNDTAEQNYIFYRNIKILCYICCILVASMIWYYSVNIA